MENEKNVNELLKEVDNRNDYNEYNEGINNYFYSSSIVNY